MMNFDLKWLADPEVFQVNTLPAVSDHLFYADAGEKESSLVRSLDGVWGAHYSLKPTEAPEGLLTGNELDDCLSPVNVPGEFQLQNPDWDPPHYVNTQYPWDGHEAMKYGEVSTEYNPTVTAVRTFALTAADMTSPRIVLTFEAVEAAVAVFVNGSFVGYSEDSFTPHRFDVTPFVHEGENRLAARVFKRCTGVWMEDQDFWRFSGIHRSVTLTFEPATHLNDIFVRTPLTENYTQAALEADLVIARPQGTVELVLTDAAGAALVNVTLPAQEKISLKEQVGSVALWSCEAPNLYDLTVTLKDTKGDVVEVSRLRVGFRQFEMINKVMCLNGKRVVFHGVNRHEFDCDLGRVMTLELMMQDIQDMKSMNVNAVRTCHYPNTSMFYRLCDEYGLYVIDETNIETHGTWSFNMAIADDTSIPGSRPDWLEATLARGRAMQERDKNHACILLWSCGNESYGGYDLWALSQMFRERDNTRLVHYEGVVHDQRYPDTTDVMSNMYAKVADIEKYLNGDPAKPFINCEYTHAMGNSCGGMVHYTELESKYPMYQGGFIWDYVDQGLRMENNNGEIRLAYGGDFGDKPTDWHFNTNGILLGDRSFTPKCQEVRQLFRDCDLVPDAHGVKVTSLRQHAPMKGYAMKWSAMVDEKVHSAGCVALPEIPAGGSVYIPLRLPETEGELIVTAWLLAPKGGILPEGTPLCFGQTFMGEKPVTAHTEMPSALIVCDANVGLRGKGWGAMHQKTLGLISFRDALGQETLLHEPKVVLFRAPTDNDRGNRSDVAQAPYVGFSLASGLGGECAIDGASLRDEFQSPALPGVKVPVTYTAMEDGLEVKVQWPGVPGLPEMPCLSLQLMMDSRLDTVTYLGAGPDDSYVDRCVGAAFGWHGYAVQDGWTRYARPQESGNRMNVRCFRLTDADGHGVEILGDALQISAQPYAPEQLMSVRHPDELAGSTRTVLNIAAFRRGVGGDDSWGAPVLPQYTYAADKPYELKFIIRSI